jgi:P-type E1-E2 ATPase
MGLQGIQKMKIPVLFNAWQSSRSARAVRGLHQVQVIPTATVLRDGAWTTIPRHAVVVGDVVQLSAGDRVPADTRLIWCSLSWSSALQWSGTRSNRFSLPWPSQ